MKIFNSKRQKHDKSKNEVINVKVVLQILTTPPEILFPQLYKQLFTYYGLKFTKFKLIDML
jgi:hypothetical protein